MIGIDDTRDDKHYGSVALERAFQSSKVKTMSDYGILHLE
jgi:hypothetical protein